MTLHPLGDELAQTALDLLMQAEASVRRRLSADLERERLSASGFSVLMVLSSGGGELELRNLRARLRTSKANATEVVTTLETRGVVQRFRLPHDRRAASVRLTTQGRELVDRLFLQFSRAEGTDVNGTGLGLYVVRSLAAAQGGAVGYAPGPHGGAVFTLTLPARPR